MSALGRYRYCLVTQCPLGLDRGPLGMAYTRPNRKLRPAGDNPLLGALRSGDLKQPVELPHPLVSPLGAESSDVLSVAGSLSPDERHLLWWLTEGRGR